MPELFRRRGTVVLDPPPVEWPTRLEDVADGEIRRLREALAARREELAVARLELGWYRSEIARHQAALDATSTNFTQAQWNDVAGHREAARYLELALEDRIKPTAQDREEDENRAIENLERAWRLYLGLRQELLTGTPYDRERHPAPAGRIRDLIGMVGGFEVLVAEEDARIRREREAAGLTRRVH